MKLAQAVCFSLSIGIASCSSSAKPEPPSGPQAVATPSAGSARDAAVVVASPDAAVAIDDKHPQIFPWASWRERNEKWLANPTNDHCDPRNRHVRQKGESECYPPTNVQLAAIVINARFLDNDPKSLELSADRGDLASVNGDYYVSLLDGDERPMTRWVHPSRVDKYSTTFVIPYVHGLNLKPGTSHAAIVESLDSDDRFPSEDPRSKP